MAEKKCPKCGQIFEEKLSSCKTCGFDLIEGQQTTGNIGTAPEISSEEIDVGPIREDEEAVLVIKKGPVIGQRINLNHGKFIIGRDPASDIFLNDITVSRKHAKLLYSKDKVEIKDAGSLNGTYVNSKRADEAMLSSGDEVQIGKFVLVFLSK